MRVDIRVGKIIEVSPVIESDKLYKKKIDLGPKIGIR